jgi:LysM repeat protein
MIKLLSLLSFVLLFNLNTFYAQSVGANNSTVRIERELQGFKTHKTSKKETLFGIAKEYNVTEEEIKKHNTFLYSAVLQKGDKLQIPIFKTIEVVETNKSTKNYIVKFKDTKWGIAYKFGISVSDLELLNPNLGQTLQQGQEIIVPNLDDDKIKEVDDKYSYYEVLPKEGFYRLKVKLGLEQSQLEALNPGLKETGLKVGMMLKVPFDKSIGNYSIGSNDGKVSSKLLTKKISDYSTKNIAVMLPFRLNRINLDSVSNTKNSINKDLYLNTSLDFHSGVLMAIDSLKKLGVSVKVDVFDTKNEVSEVTRIIETHDFKNMDAVIGPLVGNTFKKAALDLRKFNVPIFTTGTKFDLELYENVFQSRPPDDLLKSKVVNYVKSDSGVNNVAIISDSKNAVISNELKNEFANAKQAFSRKSKEGKDEYYMTVETIRSLLKPGKNVVFLETQNEIFVSSVISSLSSLIQRENKETGRVAVDIVLTTTNQNPAFEGDQINNSHLARLQFFYATNSKTYSESDNNSFVKSYAKAYNITPSKIATRGFDLTMDVVLRLVTSKNMYASVNDSPLTEYVENKFAYKKMPSGGYYNDAVYLVKYQDLNIVEVK